MTNLNSSTALLLVSCLFFALTCKVSADEEKSVLTQYEAQVLLSRLLEGVKSPIKCPDDLKDMPCGLYKFKQWENLLVKYTRPYPDTLEKMSVFQFIAYSAQYGSGAHTSEYITEIIGPIYESNPELFFKALTSSGYAVETLCHTLKGHYYLVMGEEKAKEHIRNSLEPMIIKYIDSSFWQRKCLGFGNDKIKGVKDLFTWQLKTAFRGEWGK